MLKHYYSRITLLSVLSLFVLINFSSCSNTKYLRDNQSLYEETAVTVLSTSKVKDEKIPELKKELIKLARPKPNTKVLGLFKFRLWLYNRNKEKRKGFRAWLTQKIGEKPVLMDSTLLERSVRIMNNYLFNKGYFNSSINYTVHTKNQHTKVQYTATIAHPYEISSLAWPTDTLALGKLLKKHKDKSLLKVNSQFDASILQAEIKRITNLVKNHGYYDFKSQYIHFNIDSTQEQGKVAIDLLIKPPSPPDTIHKVYHINNIFINAQFDPSASKEIYVDTLLIDDYHFITPAIKKFKPEMITDFLLIEKNDLYIQRNYDYVINQLLELGVFKFVNIRYEKVDKIDRQNWLNCYIYLTPNEKTLLSAEAEVNTQSRITNSLWGTALNFSYTNRNAFQGAEAFSFSLLSGLEFNQNPEEQGIINTLDISGKFNLAIPKFLTPIPIKRVSRFYRPKTNITLGVNYLRRINLYTLNSYNFTFGYDWRQNSQKRHIFNPIAINLLGLLDKTPELENAFDQNPLLRKSLEEQVLIGTNYSFIYSTQNLNKTESFSFLRANVDLSGNTVYFFEKVAKAAGIVDADKPIKVLSNKYSQYARFELDLRHYHVFNKRHTLVGRFNGGLGIYYGNSDVLPYVKQFFVGGANSMRAFEIRSIGPGNFGKAILPEDVIFNEFDRTGDIKLEANIEYRFNITSLLKGAVFTDIGNIWLLEEERRTIDPVTGMIFFGRPTGEFLFPTFLTQLGIGSGVGLRIDFSYFVMRFDFAVPIRKPQLAEGEKWIKVDFKNKAWREDNLKLRLAIGYPF